MKTYLWLSGVAAMLAVPGVQAQDKAAGEDYPVKPLRFIVPYAPGGPTDILARLIGQQLTQRWGQPVVADNRAGANGAIGAELLAKSPADGSVLFLGNTSILTINPAVYRRLPYDPDRHFQPVNLTVAAPLILVMHPSTGVRTTREMMALARRPGANLTFASSGTGGVSHMAGELMKLLGKINLVHVPYKGAAPAALNVITGECAMTFTSTVSAMPHVKAGRLRGIAVTTPKRDATLPDIPAIAETVSGYEVSPWYGVFVPAGTPMPIVSKLHAEITRIMRTPDMVKRMARDGGTVLSEGPEAFARVIATDRAKWARVVQATGLRMN